LNHFISELGEVGVSAFASVFNTSLMLGGLALAAFMLGLGCYIGSKGAYLAALIGAYSGISCSLVGLLPMNDLQVHTVAAFSFFYSGLVAIALFTVVILADRDRKLTRWLVVPGILTVASFVSFLAVPHLSGATRAETLDPSRFTRPSVWLTPLLEWSVFFTMLVWLVLAAAALAIKRHAPPVE